MKRILFIIVFLAVQFCFAQSRVQNWSFEDHSYCPSAANQLSYNCTNWIASRNSPDYFNSCATSNLSFSVPVNSQGYQVPHSGDAYAGIAIVFGVGGSAWVEHLRGSLIQPLVVGTKYYVTFKAALSDSSTAAINNIGALFTNVPYSYTATMSPITNYAQTYSTSILSSTDWASVRGSFVADSAYQYIVLGVFFNNIGVQTATPDNAASYYFIDDVCVSEDSLECNVAGYQIKEICANDTFFRPTGIIATTSGIYTDTLVAASGADSIVTTRLVVQNSQQSSQNITINRGEVFTLSNGVVIDSQGTYIDTLHTVYGCDSIVTINLAVIDTSSTENPPPADTIKFVMPSAFSPNGDGVNDIYSPVPSTVAVETFRIYNRWGEKVFETSGVNVGWDGKYKGEAQPSSVYAYYINIKLANGKTENRTGSFTLLR